MCFRPSGTEIAENKCAKCGEVNLPYAAICANCNESLGKEKPSMGAPVGQSFPPLASAPGAPKAPGVPKSPTA